MTRPNIPIITAQEIGEANTRFCQAMVEAAKLARPRVRREPTREPYDPNWREKLLEPGDGREGET
jgi:hypothetical protein